MKVLTLITGARIMEKQLKFLWLHFHSFAEHCKYVRWTNTGDKIGACVWH